MRTIPNNPMRFLVVEWLTFQKELAYTQVLFLPILLPLFFFSHPSLNYAGAVVALGFLV